ncbi:MAG: ABC transporter substrate-binding protein [Acidimicrobiia bacterium]|nr:ABC transporter substrate-binding protein [Acidimicrobiia bacterium]
MWATVYDLDPETWDKIPDNVTSLPTQSSGAIVDNGDGTATVQYQIVPRATWSDGMPMTGADLAFTAEAMRDLALNGNPHVDPIMANVVETNSVEQVAWVTFENPTLAIEDALWIILPSHAIADIDLGASDGFSWPSGGPFMVRDGDPSSMTRNPNYWKTDDAGRQLPYAESLTFVSLGSEVGKRFGEGDVDVVEIFDNEAVEGVAAPQGAVVESASAPLVEQITFNLTSPDTPPDGASFNGATAFREAIAHAIDRSSVLESAGIAWDATTPGVLIPKGISAWSQYQYDPGTSRTLVTSLQPVTEPISVLSTTINGSARPAIANALGASFAAIGVGYDSELLDSVQFYGDALPNGTFDLGMWAWENDGGFAATLAMLDRFDPTRPQQSFSGWGTGDETSEAALRFSELAEVARTTMDAHQFSVAVEEAESILAAELPLIPLFHRSSYLAIRSDHITGVVHNATSSRFTWSVESWQVVGQ